MKIFSGLFTALITPFTEEGEIDWDALYRLIERQIEGGVDGLVIMGTTGESPTLSEKEHIEVISKAVEKANGRTTIIAGTGSNCTREAITYSLAAEKAGADGLLIVSPYYNKPTQEGLFQHFSAIADATSLPIVLYNIAGRTGVNIETSTILRLVEAYPDSIVGVKDASGNLEQVRDVIARTPDSFCVLSGNDDQNCDIMEMGGDGAVSVLSNVFPEVTGEIIRTKNRRLAERYASFTKLLFCETNPIPVKAVLAEMGLCHNVLRLPLTPLSPNNRQKVMDAFFAVQQK